MTDPPGTTPSSPVPVLVYLPGLGRSDHNTADAVADVVAGVLKRSKPGSWDITESTEVHTPRGLTAGKTIVDADKRPVLQLFEFDYRDALDRSRTAAEPSVVPGLIRSAAFAAQGAWVWARALGRPAKSGATKVQLLIGFLAVAALFFFALATFCTLLVALGVNLPLLGKIFDVKVDPGWAFGAEAVGLTFTWTRLRKQILGLAATVQYLIRFTQNIDQVADTVTTRLDAAVDNLREDPGVGPVHVLGYSFGSLVLYEFLFPRESARLNAQPAQSVTSLVTIGCPLDIVRLYYPEYIEGRVARNPGVQWTNIFNQADIFGSSLNDGNDADPDELPLRIGNVQPVSIRYTSDTIKVRQILASGRIHSRYWGAANEASCFGPVTARWT